MVGNSEAIPKRAPEELAVIVLLGGARVGIRVELHVCGDALLRIAQF